MELNSVKDTEVLIAGAGPTGLVLGIDLARRGVRARIVERDSGLFRGARATGLQPRTQEVLEDLGVLDGIRAAGGHYPPMAFWEGDRKLGEAPFVEPADPTPHAPYGDPWMIPQWRTQELLYARLLELGGSVDFGVTLTGLDQDGECVRAHLADGDGAAGTVRAGYLVGADGGRSAVRRALGIGMTGELVAPTPMLVADVRIDGVGRGNWHMWQNEPDGGAGLLPLAGTDCFQSAVWFTDEHAQPDTSPEAVRKAIAARTHLAEEQIREVLWASAYLPRAAMADRFRVGRVFLAGDAAHVHSPAGGQGLNTSVQDAYNLGWKLGRVLHRGADDALLDTYEEERRPVAARLLETSTRLHRSRSMRRGRELYQLDLTYRGGPLAREAREGLPEGALRAGDRAPDAPCVTPGGERLRLFEAFRGPHFTLLVFGDAPLPRLDDAQVRTYRVGGTAPDLLDPDGHARAGYAARGLFLIRPDGYVALATDHEPDVTAYLAALSTGDAG